MQIHVAGDDEQDDDFHLNLLLVRAHDQAEALRRGLALGREDEQRYKNADGEDVTWTCVEALISYVLPDEELAEGSELYGFFVDAPLYEEILVRAKEGRQAHDTDGSD